MVFEKVCEPYMPSLRLRWSILAKKNLNFTFLTISAIYSAQLFATNAHQRTLFSTISTPTTRISYPDSLTRTRIKASSWLYFVLKKSTFSKNALFFPRTALHFCAKSLFSQNFLSHHHFVILFMQHLPSVSEQPITCFCIEFDVC